jgi:protein involved in polysaccharide export with SLBB domain
VPLNNANKYVAELAHIREGKTTDVRQLDLGKLLSTEDSSPVDLKDDRVDPLLRPFDQLSIYAKPDFREHRTITLGGQVARPGSYDLENDQTSLRDVIKRAGGLTPEAMPNAGIFLRPMAGLSAEKSRATALSGIAESDPTANGINEILGRLNETKRMPVSGALEVTPLLHRLMAGSLNRLVVDIPGILKGDSSSEVYLMDGDEIIIPRKTEVAYVVGETASPFAAFKVKDGAKVKDLLSLAGGTTPNADTGHIRLLKANGRIIDSWVSSKVVEPGDAVLVPQKISRDVTWQESLTALTPLAILINAVK